jgi:tryptophanyl-tRNA synthetase
MRILVAREVKEKFPGLDEVVLPVMNVKVNRDEILTQERTVDLVKNIDSESFFENPVFEAFNRFCESLSAKSKKDFPSVENLYRRYQKRGKFPQVNNIVDIVNLMALESFIPLGVFDFDKIKGDMIMRFSNKGEEFKALGGETTYLPEGLLVIADEEKILNLFPFQDSIYPNVNDKTTNIVILGDVVEGIETEETEKAVKRAGELVRKLVGGSVGEVSTLEACDDNFKVVSTAEIKKGEKRRIFAGMRPTGRLHLGNYLGSAKGMLELQNNSDFETIFMVVDLHGITTPYDKDHYQEGVKSVLKDYLAIGLNPNKSVLTVQSLVPEHIELAYLFSSVTTIGKMTHLPTFKEKVKQYPERSTMALLNYPILMAADILIYKGELVPVGIDQEPHIEVTREIARRMNQEYGTNFPEPVRFATRGEYVPSLLGEGKMSKSVEGSYISLTDNLQEIMAKVARMSTDAGGPGEIPKEGPVANIFKYLELFKPERLEHYVMMYGEGKCRYGELKQELAGAIFEEIQPIQERRAKISNEYVEEVIRDGAKRARVIAQETLEEVKEKMGLLISKST